MAAQQAIHASMSKPGRNQSKYQSIVAANKAKFAGNAGKLPSINIGSTTGGGLSMNDGKMGGLPNRLGGDIKRNSIAVMH